MLVGEEVTWEDLDGLEQADIVKKVQELIPKEAVEAGREALRKLRALRKKERPAPPPPEPPIRVAPVVTDAGLSATTIALIVAAGVVVIAGAVLLLRR